MDGDRSARRGKALVRCLSHPSLIEKSLGNPLRYIASEELVPISKSCESVREDFVLGSPKPLSIETSKCCSGESTYTSTQDLANSKMEFSLVRQAVSDDIHFDFEPYDIGKEYFDFLHFSDTENSESEETEVTKEKLSSEYIIDEAMNISSSCDDTDDERENHQPSVKRKTLSKKHESPDDSYSVDVAKKTHPPLISSTPVAGLISDQILSWTDSDEEFGLENSSKNSVKGSSRDQQPFKFCGRHSSSSRCEVSDRDEECLVRPPHALLPHPFLKPLLLNPVECFDADNDTHRSVPSYPFHPPRYPPQPFRRFKYPLLSNDRLSSDDSRLPSYPSPSKVESLSSDEFSGNSKLARKDECNKRYDRNRRNSFDESYTASRDEFNPHIISSSRECPELVNTNKEYNPNLRWYEFSRMHFNKRARNRQKLMRTMPDLPLMYPRQNFPSTCEGFRHFGNSEDGRPDSRDLTAHRPRLLSHPPSKSARTDASSLGLKRDNGLKYSCLAEHGKLDAPKNSKYRTNTKGKGGRSKGFDPPAPLSFLMEGCGGSSCCPHQRSAAYLCTALSPACFVIQKVSNGPTLFLKSSTYFFSLKIF